MPDPEPTPEVARPAVQNRLVSLAFVGLLAAPGIVFLAGVRPPLIENRAAATVPPITIRAVADPKFYAIVDQAVDDAFPLRAIAIQTRATIAYGLLRGSPNPAVVIGQGAWMFLASEVRPKCLFHSADILQTWDAIAASFARRGIDARFLIVPDKHTAYPEMLPAKVRPGDACTTAERPAMEAGMAQRPTTVDLWRFVLGGPSTGDAHYYVGDSHWTPTGAMLGIRALVESLTPGLFDGAPPVPAGPKGHVGDLTVLLGLPMSESAMTFTRPGVHLSSTVMPSSLDTRGGRPVLRFTANGTDAVVPGRTLILYDSFFGIAQNDVASWFADSVWLHIDDLSLHSEVVAAFPAFDRVVLARSERLAYLTAYPEMMRPLLQP